MMLKGTKTMGTETKDAHTEGRKEHGRFYCRACADRNVVVAAWERNSMGFYAGMYCDPCWNVDGRNHDRRFDPADAGETMEPDDDFGGLV